MEAGEVKQEQQLETADTSGDTPGEPAGAHLDRAAQAEVAPVAEVAVEPSGDEYADACALGKPKVALVGKYSDRVPVQLKSKAHLDTLRHEHGDGAVEVQS